MPKKILTATWGLALLTVFWVLISVTINMPIRFFWRGAALNSGIDNPMFRPAATQKYGSVYIGGMPIGLTLSSKGALIIGVGEVETAEGIKQPGQDAGLIAGDIIVELNGQKIYNVIDLDRAINSPENKGKTLELVYIRNGEKNKTSITPAFDISSEKHKLGVWIRDSAAGIGTVTYMKAAGENKYEFGALGHPICDSDTGVIIPILKGDVYKCGILGITKSSRGVPGELKGVFLKDGKQVGIAQVNNKFGVFGRLNEKLQNDLYPEPVEIAGRKNVKCGKASLLCSVDNQIQEYEVEIIKTYNQKTPDQKGLVIRITDQRLLQKTGGIVQGMSGSPILQNGKFVGAVTHVFVNDPTKGFGVYADWMITESRAVA